MSDSKIEIAVCGLTMAYGERVIQRDLNFEIRRGDIFIIMGGSGCGKSTLLRHLIGLEQPRAGRILLGDRDLWKVDDEQRMGMMREYGVSYQGGALWSSMTLAENIALPLEEFTQLSRDEIREVASLKLAMVALAGYEDFYPAQISGGMRKRAALARAMALDPSVLFFDEPSAGLDPVSARALDDLILELRESLGTTIVIITHELASIFAIGEQAIFLDAETCTIIAAGPPKQLLAECTIPKVRSFLTRGNASGSAGNSTGQY